MKTTSSSTHPIGVEATSEPRLRPLALWPISAVAVALLWTLLILRAATGRAGFDPVLLVHAIGADASSPAALLNPNLVTALLWGAVTVWALVIVLHAAGATPLAVAALSAVFIVSPLAWSAFLPGSPFATAALCGLGLLVVNRATLAGTVNPSWVGVVAFAAVLLNTSNLVAVLAVLAWAALAVLPRFRPSAPGARSRRPLLTAASLAVGGAAGLAFAAVLAPPRTPDALALARPLDLPGLLVQINQGLEGGLVSLTDSGAGSAQFPFSAVMTVPLTWIGIVGTVACVIVSIDDRRWAPASIGLLAATIIAAPATALLLSRISGGFFGLSGLGVASLVPMVLVASSSIARDRIVTAVVLVYALTLGGALLVWSAVVA
ncbi:hypothetical protein [Plantibacter sp. ME-Dv--P-122b]|uniref:hypothetical protein n=1 Tax=Plantibacter sp. ME-Dv--P-122b TaxID=3040300 RepID=UPI00254ED725|nr:hypothetical protein [Plantibacter sp. ME-Dv--P-122b]